jgi:hypothetical protein
MTACAWAAGWEGEQGISDFRFQISESAEAVAFGGRGDAFGPFGPRGVLRVSRGRLSASAGAARDGGGRGRVRGPAIRGARRATLRRGPA